MFQKMGVGTRRLVFLEAYITFDLLIGRTLRSESTQDKAETLRPASRDDVMLFSYPFKKV